MRAGIASTEEGIRLTEASASNETGSKRHLRANAHTALDDADASPRIQLCREKVGLHTPLSVIEGGLEERRALACAGLWGVVFSSLLLMEGAWSDAGASTTASPTQAAASSPAFMVL